MENNKNQPNKPGDNEKRPKSNLWATLIITVVVVLLASVLFNYVKGSQYKETTWSKFLEAKEQGQLAEVEFHHDRVVFMTKEQKALPSKQQKAYYTGLPTGGDVLALAAELDAADADVNVEIVEDNSGIIMILYYVLTFGIFFFLIRMLMKRMSGDGMMGGMGGNKEIGRAHV